MVLTVRDLTVSLATAAGIIQPVQDVSLHVNRGEVFGLVGESGSGKSMTCLAIMGLLPQRRSHITGSVSLEGQELIGMSEKQRQKVRGSRIAMIFQDPSSCLNPVHCIGAQIIEAVRLAGSYTRHEAEARALTLLQRVGIAEAQRRMKDYPHQLSGGMNQRVMIAMALAGAPRLLLADEPTTALDVTIQAQILDLLSRLAAEDGLGIILVTHDLGVVAQTAQRVAVMYAGRVVEESPVAHLFAAPGHPYSRALMAASPRADVTMYHLESIPGTVPSLLAPPPGCAFAERCVDATEQCFLTAPAFSAYGGEHFCACHHVKRPVQRQNTRRVGIDDTQWGAVLPGFTPAIAHHPHTE